MSHRLHLSKDKKFKKVIDQQEEYILEKRNAIHLRLCSSIMSQQLSTKVAAVIYARFLALFNRKTPPAQDILAVPFDDLRGIGLSNAKVRYIQNVCTFFIENKVSDAKLHKMENEELIEFLTQIKGIGRWTVEMILMFSLGREDVFAVDDLGIQQAMARLYKIDTEDKKAMRQQMIKIAEKWRPYRTYACRYLWNWKDNEPKN
ncbi:DNA-3-methyladenine glycosylase [Ferruginibacter sp. HRS2-29]|uniref:DNA-3-methyladenine glycosylase family protein n=1 Tax=Ferruginibacter sp. HRS2-29 TaxID=2487334 RepID=UPI0020CBFE8A|nr:DNA-3-methyladenine glycosylase 2 family protein [Ferruginibacter sp. HRS2-29]MCP9749636.1 DNA-3-methyladenine glycosylase 2 family protein [Ferruginibacter sp. HRS2-29]